MSIRSLRSTRPPFDRTHRRQRLYYACEHRTDERAMPRRSKGTRLWLRPTRRQGRQIVRNAVWIIIDGGKHVATGCLESEAGEAEKRLAEYIAEKYRPSRLVQDIDQIDVADVLSVYLDDCGPRISDQP